MPKRPIQADDMFRITLVGDPQISPDGSRILFVKKKLDEAKNKYVTNLCTVDDRGHIMQWTQGEAGAGAARWSPDGGQIAFLSKREGTAAQIYLLPVGGGEARKLTDFPEGSLGEFRWSPDGKWLCVAFREEIEDRTTKSKKEREEKKSSPPPLVTDSIWYRLDGDGYFGTQRHKLYLVDTQTGEHKLLMETCPMGSYSFDWAPNSQELAVAHTVCKNPFADPPNAQIFRVSLEGQAVKLDGLPKGEKSAVRWSPDGKTIVYAGDVDEHDPWGARNTKLYSVSANGGDWKDLTGHLDHDFAVATLSDSKEAGYDAVVSWMPDSKSILAQVGQKGESQIARVTLDGTVEILTEGSHLITMGNISNDGRRIAALFGHVTMLNEVALVEPELSTGKMVAKVLTHLNEEFHDEVKLSEPEEFWIDSTPNKDGTESKLHGWVMKPIDYLAPRRYPAILQVHGGPHTQYGWAFFHEMQLLAAQGYVVVYANPRGSKGYGEKHCAQIAGDWGHKDWEDIETAIRWMQHQPFIHPGQMGIAGGSYGGFMSCWAVGHTKVFKAAITDRCVSNMVSMAGNSDFPVNKDGYFKGVAWGDHAAIKELWRQSPIAYFEGVDTPMLIIHSEGDLRCNIEQSEQVFTALQMQNIESRFVRYPQNTSHGLSRNGPPDMRMHRLGEITAWWKKHLG